eukprot:gnl/MRDRNA2_/MRDRNA2_64257_c0_seq2.p1 gnl/MRDRNA2_/MRDRNA2_64257_c0~~gnl/MRDRNA2_/MRDRNA2_64257_c0_seq2.p1  ORF type:complete len:143 (-),score=10.18 gnl/MRDRNA2_/MRDRNA2_64257_c0_seq2:160-588(-)
MIRKDVLEPLADVLKENVRILTGDERTALQFHNTRVKTHDRNRFILQKMHIGLLSTCLILYIVYRIVVVMDAHIPENWLFSRSDEVLKQERTPAMAFCINNVGHISDGHATVGPRQACNEAEFEIETKNFSVAWRQSILFAT